MRDLETVCPDCKGEGKLIKTHIGTYEQRLLTCSLCDGKGRILTDEGAELLGFIRRWVEPITLDMLQDAFRRQARSGGGCGE